MQTLTADEKKICAAMGTSEADYLKAKRARQSRFGGGGNVAIASSARTDEAATIDSAVTRMLGPALRGLAIDRGDLDANGMTKNEAKICADMNVAPKRFLAARAERLRLNGKPLVMSARHETPRSANTAGAHGMIGRIVAQEAFDQNRAEFEKKPVDARVLATEATAASADYLKNPDTDGAWKILARASALLTGALDRCAPAYADREVDDEGFWK